MRSSTSSALDEALAGVYGVALAASADAESAAEAIAQVFRADPAGWRFAPPEELAARVALCAARSAPHPTLAMICEPDREAIVLARLLRWPVSRISDALLVDGAEVRRRLTRALRAVAAGTDVGCDFACCRA
jgi:hypothetical protein